MKINSIIIMTILPIGQRDFDRFGIAYFISQNIDVTVLNMRTLIYKNIDINYHIEQKEGNFNYIEINNLTELDIELKKYSENDTIIFSFFGFGTNSFKVYEKLSKYNIKFGSFYVAVVPELEYSTTENFIEKLLRLKNSNGIYNLFKKCLAKVNSKIILKMSKIEKRIRKYDFVVVAGKVGDSIKQNSSEKTKVIKTHALDMDFIIKDSSIKLSDDYIVYLDEYLPYHSDFALVGENHIKIADTYYKKMNIFLDYLSKRYDKEVIICAHPRSEYHKHKVWNDKKIVLFETYNYVKQSFVCLTHASTSTNFAVMLNKPISFLYLKEIEFYKFPIDAVAKSLGKNIVDIDLSKSELDKIDFINLNQSKYQEYVKNYITENIEDKRFFWEKVLKSLEEF